jgi:hypothetical protein
MPVYEEMLTEGGGNIIEGILSTGKRYHIITSVIHNVNT